MNELLKILPNEIIINNIEPYTRAIQNKELRYDIIHYNTSLKFMNSKFLKFILKYISEYVIQNTLVNHHIHFLEGFAWYIWEIDLIEYLSSNNMLFAILSRFFFSSPMNILKQIQKYNDYLIIQMSYNEVGNNICNFKRCKRRIQLLWSNMTLKERNNYIATHYI